MSVAEIIDNAQKMEAKSFEALYSKLVAIRVQRQGIPLLNELESDLLKNINSEFDPEKLERLRYLDWKMEFGALTEIEEEESLELAETYETYSVQRLKNLSQLAALRQISLDDLIVQLDIGS
ncbi:MAG: hypothetical protein EAZ91_07550 [Cytophagales bacterium]|nr:MAG: hypothetical protein EAZ91_07550 [Cytophagales bacterium]